MDDELLVKKVRVHQELYNVEHKRYSDYNHKELLWENIGIELNTTGALCKNRWISLRDQLRKKLKNGLIKGKHKGKSKYWKYKDCMSFLIPYFRLRKTRKKLIASRKLDEESNDEDEEDICVKNDIDDVIDLDEGEVYMQNISPDPLNVVNASQPHTTQYRQTSDTESTSTTLLKYFLEKDKRLAEVPSTSTGAAAIATVTSTHPIDLFFNGLSATVKSFSPELQHMAKSRIFSVVSELELMQIQNQTPFQITRVHSGVS